MAEQTSKRESANPESDVEVIKRESNGLLGTLRETLDSEVTHFSKSDFQVLKFHGIYEQYDRDTQRERKIARQELDYSFMVRVAIPGGALKSDQYLALDDLADTCGNGTLRITTRQGIQYHVVAKDDLRGLIKRVNDKLMTTLAACGDVSRNVMASPAPFADEPHRLAQRLAREIAKDLAPATSAYHEIWLNGERVNTTASKDEPFYGERYLPRKFKVGIALADDASVDLYAYDAGLLVVVEDDGIAGLQVMAGGGLGLTHNKPATMATLAKPIGYIGPDHGVEAIRTIAAIFRDHGNRSNRKQARLKYLIRDRGLDWFREEFGRRVSFDVRPPRELPRPVYRDYLGRHPQGDGKYFYGVFVQNGRIGDTNGSRVRSGLREVVRELSPNIVLMPNQNLLFTDLAEDNVPRLEAILREHGVKLQSDLTNARRYSMACPALPTCGLSLTESERVMPAVVDAFEAALADLGLEDASLTLRMTGCPNGCARPYTADIGFVGRKPGQCYNIYIGGGLAGDRMGELFAEDIPIGELVAVVRPLLGAFASHRRPDESFGDFYLRIRGRDRPNDTLTGKERPLRNEIELPVVRQ